MLTRDTNRPLASILSGLVSEVAYLVQTEIRLARAEFGEKLHAAGYGGKLIGIAAIPLVAGLTLLLLAAARWLEIAGMPIEWGLLVLGAAAFIVGVVLAVAGSNSLEGTTLVPERTLEQVRADLSIAREQTR